MEGCSSGVDQGWLCNGVPAGSLARDCLSLLYEEGLACCGPYKCSHRGFKEGGGRPRGTSRAPPFWCC